MTELSAKRLILLKIIAADKTSLSGSCLTDTIYPFNNMNSLPLGIYLENEKRFEFDFVRHLLKISYFKDSKISGTIVSPFRIIRTDEGLCLIVHNYDRSGERRITVESIGLDELVINHENTSYKLKKVA
ncbi:hypothetical protein [Mucilaginibacter defluvii]|uniref:Uncharacterized protein n=1 Tax=Mucilaginibacter defluvii TaxID=1196019 RepID=A0ABP9FNS0_9SPHI